MAKTKAAKVVEGQHINQQVMRLNLIGDTSLIVHNFCYKAQAGMLADHVGITWPKEKKVPALDFEGATYYIHPNGTPIPCPAALDWIVEGRSQKFLQVYTEWLGELAAQPDPHYGFPSVGFKAAAVRGAKSLDLVMKDMQGGFFIPVEYVEIKGARTMRSDMTRIGRGTSDIRFRPEWPQWSVEFDVYFNARVVTPDLLVNMFNSGGFACGVGEWRPEKGGSHGMFHVETA